MAVLTEQQILVTGLEATYAAAAALGDSFSNTGKQYLHVKNGGGSPITVTIDDPNSVSPTGATAFNADVAVVVTNAEERLIGPFPTSRFSSTVAVSYSAVTSVTVAVLRGI